jgi:hypothetical protein
MDNINVINFSYCIDIELSDIGNNQIRFWSKSIKLMLLQVALRYQQVYSECTAEQGLLQP